MISLRLPLRQIKVTQPFGVNYVGFYKSFGLDGHNGVDFRAKNGFYLYAAHNGIVTFARQYEDGGRLPMKHVEITFFGEKYKTIYLHLQSMFVDEGERVTAGQKIGLCDNTGKYTTGSHLHFGLKEIENGKTKNLDNGYRGAIDPTPYFNMNYQGAPIKNKDCYKSNAYHRYYRGRPKGGLKNEWRIVRALVPYLKRLPNNEEINACTYGGWDREVLKNPAMYELWAFEKKYDYLEGKTPFYT